eukprot:CAMPEP_0197470704 /NCGR_PEP_ID=MMETSP1309-20131121/1450_1 /TAXON_ID=464262 /ORGANISM="Genus nov. species nov., Strain RCC998" /LENGTH=67 /DNA_ID=CAMNT_0043007781 /DNA_START=643 /DNA_END=844 /DNA_ORIENTATION=-
MTLFGVEGPDLRYSEFLHYDTLEGLPGGGCVDGTTARLSGRPLGSVGPSFIVTNTRRSPIAAPAPAD